MKATQFSERTLILWAFFAIYVIWGSTYLATQWAFEMFPPFLMTGGRLFLAGCLMGFYYRKEFKTLTKLQVRNACGFGLLILGCGTGGSMWAVKYIDTGMASLIIGSEPLLIILLSWALLGRKPSKRKILGVSLGVLGMYVLITQEQITLDPNAPIGLLALAIAILGWVLGAMYMQYVEMPKVKGVSVALQMWTAGTALLLLSFILGEQPSHLIIHFDTKALFCAIYLLVFGSIIAYSAYNFLLLKVDTAKVATASYVNPIIAMGLGYSFNNEIISSESLIASVVLLSAVFFINKSDE